MSKNLRRATRAVIVGNTAIGGGAPVRVQTMANTDTNDIEASLAQAGRCIKAGAELLRYTTQGVREVDSLARIHELLRQQGTDIPLVADIHFNPKVAEEAAARVEKIRINPGNFVVGRDSYTPEEWDAEIDEMRQKLRPILARCRQHGTAVRIGVNLGSIGRRMISRYGNTPKGLVASCIEFIELCEAEEFHNIILSIKASNTISMIHAVRMLVCELDSRGMNYPLHLGVTEAGSDDEGRIKSAIGIGTLLSEGIGDTIRVSLSEQPEAEIPVAKEIVRYTDALLSAPSPIKEIGGGTLPRFEFSRRESRAVDRVGGGQPVVVVAEEGCCLGSRADYTLDSLPPYLSVDCSRLTGADIEYLKSTDNRILLLHTSHTHRPASIAAAIRLLTREGIDLPVVVRADYPTQPLEQLQIQASIDLGPLLIDGLVDGIFIKSRQVDSPEVTDTAFKILQSARARITATEYISCPSCGRTKFNLPEVVRQVKAATAQYVGLKIAVMGCIVNGPGEMADADFGYIGAGSGRVSIFKGRECVRKNIPEQEAIAALIDLIEAERKR